MAALNTGSIWKETMADIVETLKAISADPQAVVVESIVAARLISHVLLDEASQEITQLRERDEDVREELAGAWPEDREAVLTGDPVHYIARLTAERDNEILDAACLRGEANRLEIEITQLRGEVERLRGFAELAKRDRIGFNDNGSLDEIVLTGMAHLEQMSKGSWFLGLYRPDGSGYRLWLSAKKGPMIVSYEEDDPRTTPTLAPTSEPL